MVGRVGFEPTTVSLKVIILAASAQPAGEARECQRNMLYQLSYRPVYIVLL